MRFAMRSLFGMMLLVLTLGLLAMAVGTISGALATRNADERGREPARERVFAVNVATFEAVTAKPVLTAWGDLRSARTLELRAEAGGTLIELAPGFRETVRGRSVVASTRSANPSACEAQPPSSCGGTRE